jgi:hypothetical protein
VVITGIAFTRIVLLSNRLAQASVTGGFPLKLGFHQAGFFAQLDADVVVDKREPEAVGVDVGNFIIVKNKRVVGLPPAL